MFDVEAPIQPRSRTTIPWNLTLSAFVENPSLENGTFPEASRKVTFLCPRENEGVFLVGADESLFANFMFRNCSLNRRMGDTSYGIITTANCSTARNLGTIKFHRLDFEANFLNRSAAVQVQEPSCSSIQIVDVRFENNSCIGTCTARLVGQTEIQNTALSGNRFFDEDVNGPILITVRSGSNATIYGLVASRNNGTVVLVQDANLSISNSHVFQNAGIMNRNGYYYTGGVTFLRSSGQILDSRFEENTGHTGGSISVASSSVLIMGTSIVGSNATHLGGGISIRLSSTVQILDSLIANNSAGLNGGGVYSDDTKDLQIANTSFGMNSASYGGGLHGTSLKRASLLSCRFIQNRANKSGGGARFENGEYVIESNIFEENTSAEYGGGFRCQHSSLNVSGTTFARNNASLNGAGSSVYGNTSAWFANCTWKFNFARGRGGGALFQDGPIAVISYSSFHSNQAEYGGGAYAVEANISVLDVAGNHNTALQSGAIFYFTRSIGRVCNSLFTKNSAGWGGVFYLIRSEAWISTSSFSSNEAMNNGGAIQCIQSWNITIEDSSFASNSAEGRGGAIYVFESVVSATSLHFQNNKASSFGGAVYLQRNTFASFSHSVFLNESSEQRGGALSVLETELNLRNISIASCSAVGGGGGIYLYNSSAIVIEVSVTFCEASESHGGGMRIIESEVTGHGLNISLNTANAPPRQESYAGGILLERYSRMHFRNATLYGNRAHFGAGISLYRACVGFMSDGQFYNNSAWTGGGAAYVHDSSLTFRRVSCVRNNATYGGSIYITNSNLTLNDSQLINSFLAIAGGSLMARRGSTAIIEGTTIQSSSSLNGGGVMVIGSDFRGIRVQFRDCSAREHGGGVGLNESSSFLCIDCLFEDSSALHEGGALRAESLNPQMLAFQLENTKFRNNDAAFGGGIHFETGDGSADCSDVNSTECTFLALTGCVFTNNYARSVGGAILANNPNAIRISCHRSNKTDPFEYYTLEELRALSELSSLEVVCDSWMENIAATYGPIVGSYARRVSTSILLAPNRTKEISGDQSVLRNHSSGDPLPTISLEAVDEFSQGPALIQGNQLIEAVMTSPDGLFAGIFIVRMQDSQGIFTGISGIQRPGEYNIQINFSEQAMPTLIIVVEIRQCLIGEWRVANGTLCEPCGADSFNFRPLSNEECTPCHEDAKCDSTAIRPKKGFWHQTPCSSHVQRCLSERACDEEGRDVILRELGSSIENCTFDDQFVSNYSDALCREGYTGPLCGSCKASHGKTRSFRCEECYERFVSVCLVVLAASVLLGLSAFTIRSALPVHRHPTSKTRSRLVESASSAPVNLQMVEMWCTGIVPPEVIHPHLRTQRNGANTAAAPQWDQRNAELAKWKATEIFKITINYLQVISIAIAVNVVWSGALIALFETAEFIGGVTSEAAGRSTDCLTSGDSLFPRSGISVTVKLIIPAVVAAICAVFWALVMVRNQQEHRYLIKRCLLSIVVVSYLSYIAVTKTAVNVFYCVGVYDSVELGVSSTTKYWAMDTALKCYDGSHNVLAFVFGLPVLVLFSFGFPALIAYVLIMKRSQDGIQSPWLFETAGFLYRSYDSMFVFWESVILLRKAALAVIVVFAYPLGGNLQGILAVCVLIVALYCHTLCSPYRSEFEALNRLEGLSLLISSLTFASGLFFNDDRTSPEARATIATFVVLANVGIFIYFSVRFFVAGATYLGIVLENEGVTCDQNATAFYIVKTFVKNRLDVYLVPILRRFSVFTYRNPEESIPH